MDITAINLLIDEVEKYEAHILRDVEGKIIKRESLLEHTKLTEKYFKDIWEAKGVSEMVERFCGTLRKEMTPEAKDFLVEMIWGIPVFHDFGKINPDFQRRKLGNERISENSVFACVGGRHSIISAILYLDFFLGGLKDAVKDRTDKKLLRKFIFYHAYIIERHHSDLGEFECFLESLEAGSGNDIIGIFSEHKCTAWKKEFGLNGKKMKSAVSEVARQQSENRENEESTGIYLYVKMLYSLLVASDYYATAEFMSGAKTVQLGNLDEIADWIEIYENTELMRKIRAYQNQTYPQSCEQLKRETDINLLRTEILCDAEKVLKENSGKNIFYLEAPTGSGKSNTAMDLSFQMMKADYRLKKIYYIYPFNTLVEQNVASLEKVFGKYAEIFNNITVVNSLTPIKMVQAEKKKEAESEQTMYYQKALLDRQFLNYPMILSTHVSLFDTMFGYTKESAFGFHQLINSVVVLDEIQSYKNTIWGEIIWFLKEFSYLLNIRIIIMSATLPDLDLLSENANPAVALMKNKDKYFSNACFKERVQISYDLLEKENIVDELLAHIKDRLDGEKKILVEFIKKDSAYQFYRMLTEDTEIDCDVEYMSGDDNLMERSRILDKIKKTEESIILISTQVIEAGVDIDMDIGYKNISKLDSEEQFLGRINRSCLRKGIVYFFKLDEGKKIYREDIRTEKEFTLVNEEMKKILASKDFYEYYRRIMGVLKQNYYEQIGESGLRNFFFNEVGKLKWEHVTARMRLISEDNWSMSVYLARELEDENGEVIDGRELWREYVELLKDFQMDYSQKKVKLSRITSQMNYFIYQIKRNDDLLYDDKVGEIFYIENGEKYFESGKLNRKKIQGEIGDFVDFI